MRIQKIWILFCFFVCLGFFLVRSESESYVKRQSDVYEGSYKEDLTSIRSDQQYKAVHGHVLRPWYAPSTRPPKTPFFDLTRGHVSWVQT